MISTYLSHKLKALSFLLIILVVFLHSRNLVINIGSTSNTINNGLNAYIQYYISDGFTRIAVPLFFAISGFLFFIKIDTFNFKLYKSKIAKRVNTLLIPYLFWTVLSVVLYFVLQSIPSLSPFFTRDLIREYTLQDYINRIFFNPLPYQLWFIRDLIVIVILSPLIYLGIKNSKAIVILFFLICWFLNFNFIIFSNESILFFIIGASIALFKLPLEIPNYRKWFYIITPLWLVLLLLKTHLFFYEESLSFLITLLHKLSILIGIVSFWVFYDVCYKQKDISKTKIFKLFKFTFFIYAFQEPLLTILKKIFYYFMGKTELSSLLIYIFTPIITIATAVFVAIILNKIATTFYKTITGNR